MLLTAPGVKLPSYRKNAFKASWWRCVTEIVCYNHVRLFANTCIHTLLAGNEEGISDRGYQLINYIKTFYTGYFVPGRNKWIKPRFHPRFWYVIGSIIA